jgi:hypothetical protein
MLQHDFQDYVLGKRKRVVRSIQSASRREAVARMDVYAGAYELRLLEVLRTDFPALHVLAGDDVFEALSRAYIQAHPSDFPNARWFGNNFASFIARADAFASTDVMTEMARFEWAMGLAFDAPDRSPLSLGQLARIPPDEWPGVTFSIHPSVQRLGLTWNVPAFWKTVESKIDPPSLAEAGEPVQWVVWRPLLTTYFRSLEQDEERALDAVVRGENFESVCESLLAVMEPEKVPARAAQLVRRWTEEGLLAGTGSGP